MPDRPATPSLDRPRDGFDPSCRFIWSDIACEWGEEYRPGGHHPVQLGDVLKDGRYRIVRKLWIWLIQHCLARGRRPVSLHQSHPASKCLFRLTFAFRITRFVALKIATARLSNSASANRELGIYRKLATGPPTPSSSTCFNGLLDHFQIHGPNGVHTAFVFEPLGPHLEQALRLTPAFNHGTMFAGSGESRPLPGIPAYQRLTKYLGRRALRNVLQGLQYLHAHGIVHGDLHFGNILATTREADLVCNAAKIAELQQRPEEGRPLERVDGKKDLWAPPYQLEPAGLLEYSSTKLDPYVKIADVGGCEWLSSKLLIFKIEADVFKQRSTSTSPSQKSPRLPSSEARRLF